MSTSKREGGAVRLSTHPRVAVVGASLAGLFAAAAAASAGATVTLIERDQLPDSARSRKGVPQDRQPHILLHAGLLAACELLPGLDDDLVALGAVRFNSGRMPWLSPTGWLPTWIDTFVLNSLSRPLLEHAVRTRVTALPEVTVLDGARASGLQRGPDGWRVECEDSRTVDAEVVVDASGRGSRMPHWLEELGVPVAEPDTVDAQLGYATRVYRANGAPPLETGIVVLSTVETQTGGLALPIEDNRWMVIAAGYGERRPSREVDEFEPYLAALRDPALVQLTALLEPVTDVAIHRQTGNRRHSYGRSRDWPDGLLVVGDAYCAFNPVYGQGITVAAKQALLLRAGLRPGKSLRTRSVQRRIAAVTDLPWSIATGEDLRYEQNSGRQSTAARLLGRWIDYVTVLGLHGDARAIRNFSRVYNLISPPTLFFHPALIVSAARARVRGLGPAAPRPPVLDSLLPTGSGRP